MKVPVEIKGRFIILPVQQLIVNHMTLKQDLSYNKTRSNKKYPSCKYIIITFR